MKINMKWRFNHIAFIIGNVAIVGLWIYFAERSAPHLPEIMSGTLPILTMMYVFYFRKREPPNNGNNS